MTELELKKAQFVWWYSHIIEKLNAFGKIDWNNRSEIYDDLVSKKIYIEWKIKEINVLLSKQ